MCILTFIFTLFIKVRVKNVISFVHRSQLWFSSKLRWIEDLRKYSFLWEFEVKYVGGKGFGWSCGSKYCKSLRLLFSQYKDVMLIFYTSVKAFWCQYGLNIYIIVFNDLTNAQTADVFSLDFSINSIWSTSNKYSFLIAMNFLIANIHIDFVLIFL